jgi:RNA polymerase sigma factor for flagellar operon FliA
MKKNAPGKEYKKKGINAFDNARWNRFCDLKRNKDFGEAFKQQYIKERNAIIVDYIYIAKKLSDLMHMKHPEFDKEDLYGWGCCGLMDAIERYDVSKGIQFETFATYRVFGAMYDEMRKIDWTPRLARKRAAIIERLSLKFFAENGRNPTDEEILDMMSGEIPLGGVRALRDKRTTMMVSIAYAADEDQDWMQSLSEDSDEIKTCDSNDAIEHICSRFLDRNESKMMKCIFEQNMTLKEATRFLRIKNEKKAASIYKNMMIKLKNPETASIIKEIVQKSS